MSLAGISVCWQKRAEKPALARWIRCHPGVPWGLAALIYLASAQFWIDEVPPSTLLHFDRAQYADVYLFYAAIAVLVPLPAIFGDGISGVSRRIMAHPTLGWLGLVSYGIFLWQWPVMPGLASGGVQDWRPAHPFPCWPR